MKKKTTKLLEIIRYIENATSTFEREKLQLHFSCVDTYQCYPQTLGNWHTNAVAMRSGKGVLFFSQDRYK